MRLKARTAEHLGVMSLLVWAHHARVGAARSMRVLRPAVRYRRCRLQMPPCLLVYLAIGDTNPWMHDAWTPLQSCPTQGLSGRYCVPGTKDLEDGTVTAVIGHAQTFVDALKDPSGSGLAACPLTRAANFLPSERPLPDVPESPKREPSPELEEPEPEPEPSPPAARRRGPAKAAAPAAAAAAAPRPMVPPGMVPVMGPNGPMLVPAAAAAAAMANPAAQQQMQQALMLQQQIMAAHLQKAAAGGGAAAAPAAMQQQMQLQMALMAQQMAAAQAAAAGKGGAAAAPAAQAAAALAAQQAAAAAAAAQQGQAPHPPAQQ